MIKTNKAYVRKNSLRLNDFDYSRAGFYFLTVDVRNMLLLFGKIQYNKMILNPAGGMIYKWYSELENKFPNVKCHESIVMPNHFHCIIEIKKSGVTDCNSGVHVGTPLRGCPNDERGDSIDDNQNTVTPQMGIPEIMDWFKTMTTNEYIRGVKQYNWERFNKKLWQRSYYDHIIRNQQSYDNIRNYITANPEKWEGDKFYQNTN